MHCCLFNARSLKNKLPELNVFADEFDIVLVTESRLDESVTAGMLCGDNYNVLRYDTPDSFGGVCVLVNNTLKFQRIEVSQTFSRLQLVCFDVVNSNERMRFVCVYRPPYYTMADYNYAKSLADCLSVLVDVSYPSVIVGDLNLPDVEWETLTCRRDVKNVQSTLLDCFSQLGLSQLALSPTRGDNVLDLVLCNSPSLMSNVAVSQPLSTSDHSSVVFGVCFDGGEKLSVPKRCNFRLTDYVSMELALATVNWASVFANCVTPSDHWSAFLAVLNPLIEQFVPLSRPRKRNTKYPVIIGLRQKRNASGASAATRLRRS